MTSSTSGRVAREGLSEEVTNNNKESLGKDLRESMTGSKQHGEGQSGQVGVGGCQSQADVGVGSNFLPCVGC